MQKKRPTHQTFFPGQRIKHTLSTQFTEMSSNPYADFDEKRWVIQIRQTLDDDLDEEGEVPVCIFNVPKSLMASDPDSYIPQQVAIGPYHNRRVELFEMERYKLAAAKRAQRRLLQSLKFHNFVHHLMELESRIRGCYHRYIDFNGETLSWMMAIDGSFLLEFFHVYAVGEERALSRSLPLRLWHLVDYAGRKSAHNAILRDIVMLENQIPLIVLRKMLEFQFSSIDLADDQLISMLLGLYKELSPFKMLENLPRFKASEFFHLLDFLYQMNSPKLEEPSEAIEIDEDEKQSGERTENSAKFTHRLYNLMSILKKTIVHFMKRVLISGLVKIIFKVPWIILSNLPVFAAFKQPVEYLIFSHGREETKQESNSPGSINGISSPPLMEEIAIPSVTELSNAGVRFSPTSGGILSISFDVKSATFHLPTMSLDVNTEVVLRNLVAYEATNASGPLAFARFTELINGIIDTEDDVKLLREKGVVLNHLKSDEEVARMWNGMNKSIRLTKVAYLDKVIEDVNRFYNSRFKIKAANFVQTRVFRSWPSLTLLAAILLLFLTIFQAFYTVYYSRYSNLHKV